MGCCWHITIAVQNTTWLMVRCNRVCPAFRIPIIIHQYSPCLQFPANTAKRPELLNLEDVRRYSRQSYYLEEVGGAVSWPLCANRATIRNACCHAGDPFKLEILIRIRKPILLSIHFPLRQPNEHAVHNCAKFGFPTLFPPALRPPIRTYTCSVLIISYQIIFPGRGPLQASYVILHSSSALAFCPDTKPDFLRTHSWHSTL